MKFVSTRSKTGQLTFSECITLGMAPDGGLFVPTDFPDHSGLHYETDDTLATFAAKMLRPFFEGDPLEPQLGAICEEAFDFPIPLKHLIPRMGVLRTGVLELFHGPTAAFKDVGARFLAACLARIPSQETRTVLVATSGDTGGAVAAAFHRRPGFEVAILFPKDKVSARQEKQLTSWGDNVRAIKVQGDFDACQRIVKEAFADAHQRGDHRFVSANSINIGRLLPQTVYYAAASLWYRRDKNHPIAGFIVPTGNLGNAVAALWAKRMGFPIRAVVLATNANKAIPNYFSTGKWKPLPTVSTLANAMDVGNPSNMERLLHLYPTPEALKRDAQSYSVTDKTIEETITTAVTREREVWCPHTATAGNVRRNLPDDDWVIVATAHPAKFESIVEPLIKRSIDVPPALATIFGRPSTASEIQPTLAALLAALK